MNLRLRKALNFSKVYTVSNTYNNYFKNPMPFKYKISFRENGEIRLLTISAYYKHKNLEIIPEILEILRRKGIRKIKFILTLDKAVFERLFSGREDIINVGPVNPEECPSLYSECDFMFLPTLAECFSASYPEAMIMKKPIITTDLGFARDICRDAAIYFEPLNPDSAASAIERLVTDNELIERLIENGLKRVTDFNDSFQRADKIISICREIADERKN